jgi:hypothetical protein
MGSGRRRSRTAAEGINESRTPRDKTCGFSRSTAADRVAAPAVVPVVAVPVETQVVQVPAAVAGHLAVAVVVDRVAAPVVVQTILPVRPMTNHQDKGNHLASHNKQMSLPKTHRKTRR